MPRVYLPRSDTKAEHIDKALPSPAPTVSDTAAQVGSKIRGARKVMRGDSKRRPKSLKENANSTIKQKPTRRSKRLRGVVAFTYDRNLGGDVGGILVRTQDGSKIRGARKVMRGDSKRRSKSLKENANATIKQKPTRRSKRLRGVVAFTYDRNLGGGVGGILVRGKQTQAPSHYNNGHLTSDVCRQIPLTASAESGDAMASDKPLSSPAPTGGNVGGIRKQTQAPSHYNNEHLASDVCRQIPLTASAESVGAMASDKALPSPAPTDTGRRDSNRTSEKSTLSPKKRARSSRKSLKQMSNADVCDCLRVHGLSEYVSTVATSQLSGQLLQFIDDDLLEHQFKINNIEHRHKILYLLERMSEY